MHSLASPSPDVSTWTIDDYRVYELCKLNVIKPLCNRPLSVSLLFLVLSAYSFACLHWIVTITVQHFLWNVVNHRQTMMIRSIKRLQRFNYNWMTDEERDLFSWSTSKMHLLIRRGHTPTINSSICYMSIRVREFMKWRPNQIPFDLEINTEKRLEEIINHRTGCT